MRKYDKNLKAYRDIYEKIEKVKAEILNLGLSELEKSQKKLENIIFAKKGLTRDDIIAQLEGRTERFVPKSRAYRKQYLEEDLDFYRDLTQNDVRDMESKLEPFKILKDDQMDVFTRHQSVYD
jgi:hypothetical protein